ncbi:MAG: hypothetical protein FD143_3500 [Ignavibacteria bacterium]|nr:MAG: hypothetical protein FD143_3500 [Ignavibacteria bacterium]
MFLKQKDMNLGNQKDVRYIQVEYLYISINEKRCATKGTIGIICTR